MPVKDRFAFTKIEETDNFDVTEHPPACPNCEEKFIYRYQLQWHFQWKHGSDGELFICSQCNETFPSEFKLRWHKIAHGYVPKHACEKCNEKFDTDFELRKHHLTHSRSHISFECDKCFKAFSDKLSLTRHQESYVGDTAVKRHSCTGCFTRKSFRVNHAKSRIADCSYMACLNERVCAHGNYRTLSL